MASAVPFVLGQEGRRTATTNNPRYVRSNAQTRDESMDGTKYPLHRLEREPSQRSEAAQFNQQEAERVRRVRERLRNFSGAE